MTVREHITKNLYNLNQLGFNTFRTSDIQELSYEYKNKFGKYLGSTETYTREFRRMREDCILEVEKIKGKGRQQTWKLKYVIPF